MCDLVGAASSLASPPSPSNECGCSQFGDCTSSGSCVCHSGYEGSSCSYSTADFTSLTSQISNSIDLLHSNLATLSDNAVLTDLALLTRSAELVVSSSALTAVSILQSIIDETSSTSER